MVTDDAETRWRYGCRTSVGTNRGATNCGALSARGAASACAARAPTFTSSSASRAHRMAARMSEGTSRPDKSDCGCMTIHYGRFDVMRIVVGGQPEKGDLRTADIQRDG